MNLILKINEKKSKLFQYIRLKKMFAVPNEFIRVHPELRKIWEKRFRQMIRFSSQRTFPIAEEFLNVRIEKVSERKVDFQNGQEPILLCALKDDIDKLPYFMEHYRKRGIEHFVFLDNMSTDGSFEYLLQQKDADVYRCRNSFTADRKIAWLNRLIAEYGANKWFLMVDSDEFFTYFGDESFKFSDVIKRAEQRGYKRLGVVHLDMYPKGPLFDIKSNDDFLKKYCYFDKDTYFYHKADMGMSIKGGPRKRVFDTNMCISGYRMVYFENDDVVPSSHFIIPYHKSYGVPVCLISLHYKFVNESDYDKMIEAVKTGIHSNNSAEYKTYYNVIKDNPQISLFDEKHSVILTEENLRQIDFVDDIFD